MNNPGLGKFSRTNLSAPQTGCAVEDLWQQGTAAEYGAFLTIGADDECLDTEGLSLGSETLPFGYCFLGPGHLGNGAFIGRSKKNNSPCGLHNEWLGWRNRSHARKDGADCSVRVSHRLTPTLTGKQWSFDEVPRR